MVEIEEVAIQILYGKLPQSPRFQFQRLDDARAHRHQTLVGGIDIFGEDPMDGRFKWRCPLAKEDRYFAAGYSPHLSAREEPSNLKPERVSVMLLREFDIGDR